MAKQGKRRSSTLTDMRWNYRYEGFSIFAVLFLINFLNYLERYFLAGAANGIAKELHFGIAGIGVLASAYLICVFGGAIPLGMWADRGKRTRVIALCVGIWSLAAMGTGLAWGFGALFVFRMIGGIGETGYSQASSTLLADVFSRAKRARILSWWSIASLFGFLAGNILGGVLGNGGMWRWAFLGMGLGGLVLAWLAWRIPEPVREQPEQVMSAREEAARPAWARIADMPDRLWHFWEQVLLLLRVKSLLAVIVMLGGAFFVLYTTGVYLSTLLQQKDLFGLSATDAGLVNGVVGAGAGIVGTLLGGYLMDVLTRRWPGAGLLICGVGFLLSVPCLGLEIFLGFTTHSLALFVGFHFAVLLLVSLLEGMVGVTVQDVVPTDQRASALAIVSLASSLLGEFFSPLLVGMMAVLFDPTRGQHFMQGQAGHDLGLALIASCVPALVLAGVVGMLAMCWMKVDQQNARIPFMKC